MIWTLIKRYWFQIIFFSLAVACDAGMDYFNFVVPHDSGFWSLHTEGLRFDAWHSLKVLKWTFIAIGMVPTFDWIIVAGALNSFLHGFIYHRILKNLKRNNSYANPDK